MAQSRILFIVALLFGSNALHSAEPDPLLALMTDSHVVELEQPPETVWAHVKRLYHAGDRYRARGLKIVPITDEPAAFLGGYRGVAEQNSDARELVVHFSAVDDDNMFLSMYMDSLLPRGLYITHDVSPSPNGSRYQVIIHGYMPVDLPEGVVPTSEKVNEWMTSYLTSHNEGLREIVDREITQALK